MDVTKVAARKPNGKKKPKNSSKKLGQKSLTKKQKPDKIVGSEVASSVMEIPRLEKLILESPRDYNNATATVQKQKKQLDYLTEKRIVMNKATNDNDNISMLVAMPARIDALTGLVQSSVVADHSLDVSIKILFLIHLIFLSLFRHQRNNCFGDQKSSFTDQCGKRKKSEKKELKVLPIKKDEF